MQIKRPPDLLNETGSKFWFKELIYWSNTTGYRSIHVDKEGKLRMHTGKNGLFKAKVQQLFREWAMKEAEEVLLNGQTQEKND